MGSMVTTETKICKRRPKCEWGKVWVVKSLLDGLGSPDRKHKTNEYSKQNPRGQKIGGDHKSLGGWFGNGGGGKQRNNREAREKGFDKN